MAQAQDNLQIGNDTRPIVSKGMGTQEDVGGTGTASQSYTQGSYFVGNDGFMYQADSAIAQNATIIPSGTGKNCTKTDIAAELGSVKEALTNQVLYFTSVACSATTGNFATKSDASITADHVVAECVFANPSAITTDVTWTTANGSVTLNGTCTSATTANLVLVKKGN